jgi:hypothetical protein
MAIIKLRSPRYETINTPTGAVSAKLELTIDSTLRYTIIKSCTAGEDVVFEISELCRDYLTVTANADGVDHDDNDISISRVITFYSLANGNGSVVAGGNTVTHTGVDGYGNFLDGVNPTIATSEVFLLSPDYSASPDDYKVYAPVNVDGSFPYLDAGGNIQYHLFNNTDTSVTIRSQTITIERLDCSKYSPSKILFLNKFGTIQELWFQTKIVESIDTQKEQFQRDLMDFSTANTPTYSDEKHNIKIFKKNGKQRYTISSGYYPEWTNNWFEELLLSEYVWLYRETDTVPNEIVPLNITTSSFTKKTQLNDRLIEYTIEFEEAFDYINNIR